MKETDKMRNADVPIETILKWKQVECWKLRAQTSKQERTIKALRKNLDIVLKDKALRREIAKELFLREKTTELHRLSQKLHNAYESIKELITTNVSLQKKLEKYEQGSDQSAEAVS